MHDFGFQEKEHDMVCQIREIMKEIESRESNHQNSDDLYLLLSQTLKKDTRKI